MRGEEDPATSESSESLTLHPPTGHADAMNCFLFFLDPDLEGRYVRFRNLFVVKRLPKLYMLLSFVFASAGVLNIEFFIGDALYDTFHAVAYFVIALSSLFGAVVHCMALPPGMKKDKDRQQARLQWLGHYATFLAIIIGTSILLMAYRNLKSPADFESKSYPVATIFYYEPLFPAVVLVRLSPVCTCADAINAAIQYTHTGTWASIPRRCVPAVYLCRCDAGDSSVLLQMALDPDCTR